MREASSSSAASLGRNPATSTALFVKRVTKKTELSLGAVARARAKAKDRVGRGNHCSLHGARVKVGERTWKFTCRVASTRASACGERPWSGAPVAWKRCRMKRAAAMAAPSRTKIAKSGKCYK